MTYKKRWGEKANIFLNKYQAIRDENAPGMEEVLWMGWKKETNCDMMKFPLISQWMGYFLSESGLL